MRMDASQGYRPQPMLVKVSRTALPGGGPPPGVATTVRPVPVATRTGRGNAQETRKMPDRTMPAAWGDTLAPWVLRVGMTAGRRVAGRTVGCPNARPAPRGPMPAGPDTPARPIPIPTGGPGPTAPVVPARRRMSGPLRPRQAWALVDQARRMAGCHRAAPGRPRPCPPLPCRPPPCRPGAGRHRAVLVFPRPCHPAAASLAAAGRTVADPAVADPAVADPTVAGPTVAGPALAGPTVAGPVAAVPAAGGRLPRPGRRLCPDASCPAASPRPTAGPHRGPARPACPRPACPPPGR